MKKKKKKKPEKVVQQLHQSEHLLVHFWLLFKRRLSAFSFNEHSAAAAMIAMVFRPVAWTLTLITEDFCDLSKSPITLVLALE